MHLWTLEFPGLHNMPSARFQEAAPTLDRGAMKRVRFVLVGAMMAFKRHDEAAASLDDTPHLTQTCFLVAHMLQGM